MYPEFAMPWEPINSDFMVHDSFDETWQPTQDSMSISLQERIDAATIIAWNPWRPFSDFVVSNDAYTVLKCLYFTLRRRVYRRCTRTGFTKDEYTILLAELSSHSLITRERRQSVQALDQQLKETLKKLPQVKITFLQNAAKKCISTVHTFVTRQA
jgi:hypothetical protein